MTNRMTQRLDAIMKMTMKITIITKNQNTQIRDHPAKNGTTLILKTTRNKETDHFKNIKNSTLFQNYLQKEAMQNDKVKEPKSLKYEDKRNEYEFDQRDQTASQRQSISRQTFGEKVQRFNKPLVGGNEDEEQFYQQNYSSEYPTNQNPQKYFPQNTMQGMSQRKFGMYDNPYNTQHNVHGSERELSGSSEMVMISKGMSKNTFTKLTENLRINI